MDYDENDFQNQNHLLAGDSTNKFPAFLNPYALPRFDFDDSLQGHLRFDSQVESELFLGIEDFSRGSCGIHFSKTAADSCSISRCNNVWSEATSSESVEMLLNSVGHEETMPKQNSAEVSDAFDELGCLTQEMEPNVVVDLLPAFTLEEVPQDSSRLKNYMGTEVDSSLQGYAETIEKVSCDMDLDSGGKSGLLAEKYLFDGGTSLEVSDSGRNVHGLVVDSVKNDMTEDVPHSEFKHDPGAVTDSENIYVKEKLKSQEELHTTGDILSEDKNDLQKSSDLLNRELHTLENEDGVKIQRSGGDKQHVDGDDTHCLNLNLNAVESISSHLHGAGQMDSHVEILNEENAGKTLVSAMAETSTFEFDTGSLAAQGSVEEDCRGTTLQACTSQDASLEDAVDQSKKSVRMQSHTVSEVDLKIDSHQVQLLTSKQDMSYLKSGHVEEKDKFADGRSIGDVFTGVDGHQVEVGSSEAHIVQRGHVEDQHESGLLVGGVENTDGCQFGLLRFEKGSDSYIEQDHSKEKVKFGDDQLVVEVERMDVHQVKTVHFEQGVDSGGSCHTHEKDESGDGQSPGGSVERFVGDQMEVVRSEQGNQLGDNVEVKDNSANVQSVGAELEGNSGLSSFSEQDKVPKSDADTCKFGEVLKDTVAVISTRSPKIEVPVEDMNVDNKQLSSAHVAIADSINVNGQGGAPDPSAVPVCKEESTMLPHTSSNVDVRSGVPVGTDEGVEVPSISESGNKDVIADIGRVNESEFVAVQSSHLDSKNDAAAESNGSDLFAEVSDSSLAVLQESHSEVVENEQSQDTTIPEFVPVPETGKPESLGESQIAEVRATFDTCGSTLSVHLPDVANKGDSSAEVAITHQKPKEISHLESSSSVGDESKHLESTLISAVPSPEGLIVSDAPEDGRKDHRNSDKQICDSQVAAGNGSFATNQKEKGDPEIPAAQDIGKSESEKHASKVGPCSPGSKEKHPSQSEKSLALEIVEASPQTVGPVQTGTKVQHSGKRGGTQTAVKRSSKATPDRKPRRVSTRSAGRESAKKVNLVKEIRPLEKPELPGKVSNVSFGPGTYQLVQPSGILHRGQMDSLCAKPFAAVTTSSALPDLNSSAFPFALQQPFNDMQQVQLRAQILVYGSLISKFVPDELHMVSAFGGPDGGRSIWEKAWQTFKARLSLQTPHLVTFETTPSSRSGDVASDSVSKQNKVNPSPAARASTSGTPPSINPMIPLSSPLWSLPTPSVDILKSSGLPRGDAVDFQPLFPQLASQQTQPIKSYAGQGTAWMSHAPFRGPWGATLHTPALNTNSHFPLVPSESFQLTPARESFLAFSPGMKQAPEGPSLQGEASPNTVAASPALDLAKGILQSDPSSDQKSKKRKRFPPSEDQSMVNLHPQLHSEKLSVSAPASVPSASAAATKPADSQSKGSSPIFTTIVPDMGANTGMKPPIISEVSIVKVKEAGQQAQNAAALAAAAVDHSQEVWNELDKKKTSGIVSVLEARLSYSDAAIAAAVAIAKAAAAVANVASNAALQEKAMADKALSTGDYNNPFPSERNLPGGFGLKSSSSIIFAAKEAARRRVEATSAAALWAENLDIIVKAAELAAEAISQVGKVVTTGDPSSLNRLTEAGPEGFWKLPQFSSEQACKVHDPYTEGINNESFLLASIDRNKSSAGPPDIHSEHSNQHVLPPVSEESLRNPMEDQVRLIVGLQGSFSPSDQDQLGQKSAASSVLAGVMDVNRESPYGLRSHDIEIQKHSDKAEGVKKNNCIQQGSRVEVFKDGDDCKGAWFAADVMSLKDGKAHVCYSGLPSIKGSGKLQEWINLAGAGDAAPRIRIPHPLTGVQLDGSRKRRRAAIGSFTCSVGDKVDAWIRDSWWEGVVTEKKDETSAAIQLPALGETSVIRTWHLRPSVIWINGEWIEWSSNRENDHSHHEGDTPNEKRAKVGSSGSRAKVKDEGSKLLDLSAQDKVFDIGRASMDEDKPGPRRTMRSASSKQGTGVAFGVPKPGKKRKLMDVSKSHVEDQNDKAEISDSVKLANYLMPRGSGPVPSGRKAFQKISSRNTVSVSNPSFTERVGRMKDSSGHVGKHNLIGSGSFSSSTAGGTFAFSSRALPDANKKMSTPKSGPVHKDKPSSSTSGRLGTIKEDEIINTNLQVEPRRSNRQIQPTSRLLEGLQSSLVVPKAPSSLHDKGQKVARGATKGSNHR